MLVLIGQANQCIPISITETSHHRQILVRCVFILSVWGNATVISDRGQQRCVPIPPCISAVIHALPNILFAAVSALQNGLLN
jgi:hypothetical protein